jgi:hypothetical protein
VALKTDVVDRVPLYPGRVRMTPVSGQANTYDMVRADQPVQEGTPINKALFDKKADVLTENVTVYVAKSGNDSIGDGTSGKPYATIQKAIDSIPKNLGGFVATVHIGQGAYSDPVNIEYFHGGRVVLTGETTTTVTISGLVTIRDSYVHFEYFGVVMSGTYVYVTQGGRFFLGDSVTLTCTGGEYGVYARYNSKVSLGGKFVANSTTVAAIRSGSCSDVYAHNASGSGNKIAFSAVGGSIRVNTNSIAATTMYSTAAGGRIYTAAQQSAANY